MSDKLVPKRGHVVMIAMPYRCDFCGAPATWDAPTLLGPWANMCDEHEAQYHVAPGQTGVGIGQRLIVKAAES